MEDDNTKYWVQKVIREEKWSSKLGHCVKNEKKRKKLDDAFPINQTYEPNFI